MSDDERFMIGSGNVYEDLGFDDPEGELAKADLAIEIIKVIRARGLTQQEAARIMGIQQPRVSRITRGRLDGITTDALIGYLRQLGQNIEVIVTAADPISASAPTRQGSFVVRGYEGDVQRPLTASGKAKAKVSLN